MYAMLNDAEKPARGEVLDALKQYDIIPVPFSDRLKYKAALAA